MAAVTAGVVIGAVIAAGAGAAQANKNRQQARDQANDRNKQLDAKRKGEVAAQEADAQRSRDSRAVAEASAQRAGDIQLREQGISTGGGDQSVDTAALGATAANTSAASLGAKKHTSLGG